MCKTRSQEIKSIKSYEGGNNGPKIFPRTQKGHKWKIVLSITHKRGELIEKQQHILVAHIRSRRLPPNIGLFQQKYFFLQKDADQGQGQG